MGTSKQKSGPVLVVPLWWSRVPLKWSRFSGPTFGGPGSPSQVFKSYTTVDPQMLTWTRFYYLGSDHAILDPNDTISDPIMLSWTRTYYLGPEHTILDPFEI